MERPPLTGSPFSGMIGWKEPLHTRQALARILGEGIMGLNTGEFLHYPTPTVLQHKHFLPY